MFKHGLTLLFTLLLSVSLAGCFGGNGSSKADTDGGDRSSDTGDASEESLDITDAFSVDAGKPLIQTDAGAQFELTGTISHPDSVTIAESYWRTFSLAEGFQRIDATVATSDADNVYAFTAGRYLERQFYVYQFVAIDTEGRAAVDTVRIDVKADTPSLSASLRTEAVTEGENIVLALLLGQALDEDLLVNFALESGTATIGEDVADCSPCSLTIPAGETSASVSLETLIDELEEGQESFYLTLTDYVEALGEASSLELLIDDSGAAALSIVSFRDTEMQVTEKSGEIRIPLIVEEQYPYIPLTLTHQASVGNSVQSQGVVAAAALPGVSLGYEGSATVNADYALSDGTIYYDDDNVPYLLLEILDDTESETPENITLTLVTNPGYELGEVTEVNITITSDDVRLMASATDAYCTVEDHLDIRCWGDFRDGKTATPVMGEIEKLVGASDYFCAIHRDDGVRRLSCWGNVPGDFDSETEAPDDIVALDDYICKFENGEVTCYTGEYVPIAADGMAGAHQGFCYLGEGVDCNVPELSANVTDLLTPGGQFLYDEATIIDGVEYPVACARSFDEQSQVYRAACHNVTLPDTLVNPVAMAAVNLDYALYVCLIDQTAAGNELVCVNRSGEPAPLFSDLDVEEPYKLTSDFDTHLCVSHLNGVDCIEWDGVSQVVPLIHLQAAPVSAISGGPVLGVDSYGSSLCGLQGGVMNCLQPGLNQSAVSVQSPDDGAIARLDFEYNMPAVVTASGELHYYWDFGQVLFPNQIGLEVPMTAGESFAKGNGFVCYQNLGAVFCEDYAEMGINRDPGISVATATDLAAGNEQACALVNNQVLCWSSSDPADPLVQYELTDRIAAMDYAGYTGCAVTVNNALYCWGDIFEYVDLQQGQLVGVGTVESVAVANRRVCVQGDQGVKCWSSSGSNGIEINAEAITDLTVTNDFACIIENEKTRCWGDYAEEPRLL